MAREIPEYLARCAADLGGQSRRRLERSTAPRPTRSSCAASIAKFWKRCAASPMARPTPGAKWLDRSIDLIDIVVANIDRRAGRTASRHADDADRPRRPDVRHARLCRVTKHDSVMDHCSAFAATGPATRDGKMVIGHVTWWPLTLAEQTNVMLDIKPDNGPSHADAELSRRHRERHRLVSERCRHGAHRNHHPPDAVQRAGHAGGVPRAHGHPVRRQHRRGGDSSSARATTASTPTSG